MSEDDRKLEAPDTAELLDRYLARGREMDRMLELLGRIEKVLGDYFTGGHQVPWPVRARQLLDDIRAAFGPDGSSKKIGALPLTGSSFCPADERGHNHDPLSFDRRLLGLEPTTKVLDLDLFGVEIKMLLCRRCGLFYGERNESWRSMV